MRNNNQPNTYPKSLKDIHHLSNSNVSIFEQCPRRWASNYIFGEKGVGGKAAKIGSTIHEEMEKVHETKSVTSAQELVNKGVDQSEAYKVVSYQQRHIDKPHVPSLVEQEFLIEIMKDMPPVLAYIDLLEFIDDETVLITDHKSNRQMESIEDWKKKLQPPLYALAVRTYYPKVKTVRFRIGYVMFDQDLEWEISKEESDAVIGRMINAWNAMKAYARGTESVPNMLWFPEVIGDGCQWCHMKKTCRMFQDEIAAPFQTQLNVIRPKEVQIKTLAQELDVLKTRKKLIESAVEETEEALKELVPSTITIDNVTVKISQSRRREIPITGFINGLQAIQENSGLPVLQQFWENADGIVSFKLGEFDKYIKGHADLEALSKSITEIKLSKPSVSVVIS